MTALRRSGVRVVVATVTAAAGVAGCGPGVLSPAGPVGRAERLILFDALAIMLAIVVPTIVATLACAWWFRAGNARARYRPTWAYSGRLELLVWSIPALAVLVLGGIAWVGSHRLDPGRPLSAATPPLEIEVVALDWKWLFIYPAQGIATVDRLPVPAGRPLHFRLTSASVMNVFFVPRLGSMIYAMNGMATQLWLQADRAGAYEGRAAQINGDGFPDMTFEVVAMPAAEFERWAAAERGRGPPLDRDGYRALLARGRAARPGAYGTVDPGLFDAIVAQRTPPQPGPQTGTARPSVRPGADVGR